MHAERATLEAPAALRIVRDAGAIVGLAAERVGLHLEERRQRARASATPPERARRVRWTATWQAAAVGGIASLPADPVCGLVAATIEAGLLAEIASRATASLRVMTAGELVPGQARGARRAMLRAGMRKAVTIIAARATRSAAKVVLKELGLALPRLGLRAAVGAAAPAMGAAWSGTWNALEMHRRLTPAVRAIEDAWVDEARSEAAPLAPFALIARPAAAA